MEIRSKKRKNKNIVGPNHNTSQVSTAEIPDQGNQSGVPIPESYLCSTHLSTIYFIPTRTRSKLVFFFAPTQEPCQKKKERRRKIPVLGFSRKKKERRWLNVCYEYTDLCCMIDEGEGIGKSSLKESGRKERSLLDHPGVLSMPPSSVLFIQP